jgi:hypothetical protein
MVTSGACVWCSRILVVWEEASDAPVLTNLRESRLDFFRFFALPMRFNCLVDWHPLSGKTGMTISAWFTRTDGILI